MSEKIRKLIEKINRVDILTEVTFKQDEEYKNEFIVTAIINDEKITQLVCTLDGKMNKIEALKRFKLEQLDTLGKRLDIEEQYNIN